jgi:hemolysin III
MLHRMPVRPRFRGVSHRVAFYVAVVAGSLLVVSSVDARAMIATAIYAFFLAGMFGVSATLHRRDWSPRAFGWLRRADHATIFTCMAGTYTPFCLLGIGPPVGTRLLILAWSAAGLGILRAFLWPHAPRAITAALYVCVGWVAVAYLPEVRASLEPVAFVLLIAGGIAFTAGALVYLFKFPDPSPAIFGYHEVFHLMIIAGCSCHFAGVVRLATRARSLG